MALLTKRERVMRTIRFEETDRVPLYDIIHNDAIIEHYSGRKLTIEDGDWIAGTALGRALDMTRMATGPWKPHEARQPDGILIKYERWTLWATERPFHDMPTLVEWVKERIRQMEKLTYDSAYVEQFRQQIERCWASFAEGDPTGQSDPAVLVQESGVGLTVMLWSAGWDLFVPLMFEYPDLVEEWLAASHEAELRRVAAIADPNYIPVALTFDDIAHKTGLMFSPDWLRKYWVPKLKRLNDAWHERGTVCLFHSDGNLWPILDDLVAAGIDGLNPLEVMAGMSVKGVRKKYPGLFLTGGIDVSQLLPFGKPEEVRAACEQAIADTGNVGYFLGSTTELHSGVKLENAKAMFETAWATQGNMEH